MAFVNNPSVGVAPSKLVIVIAEVEDLPARKNKALDIIGTAVFPAWTVTLSDPLFAGRVPP
jgi:hypothetical protein